MSSDEVCQLWGTSLCLCVGMRRKEAGTGARQQYCCRSLHEPGCGSVSPQDIYVVRQRELVCAGVSGRDLRKKPTVNQLKTTDFQKFTE